MSIALFGAVRAGIFVACSAGNFGPRESTLSNVAPWIASVGAATVDRVFPVSITLGNGQVLTGQSLYAHTTNPTDMIRLLPSNCSNCKIRGALEALGGTPASKLRGHGGYLLIRYMHNIVRL